MTIQTKKRFWLFSFIVLPILTLIATYSWFWTFGNTLGEDDLGAAIFSVMILLFAWVFVFAQVEFFFFSRIKWFPKETHSKLTRNLSNVEFWACIVWFAVCSLLGILGICFLEKVFFQYASLITLIFVVLSIILNLLAVIGWIARNHSCNTKEKCPN